MEFQFNNLHFDTFPDDEFRFYCGPDTQQSNAVKKSYGNILWMESKRTKAQWSAEVMDDVSKYGPIGIPHEALFDVLKKALEEKQINDNDAIISKRSGTQFTLVCNMNNCSKAMELTLTMYFTEVWSNVYKFTLEAKEVSKVETIVAKLRDAEEEIVVLKEELKYLKNKPIIKFYGSKPISMHNGQFCWEFNNMQIYRGDKNIIEETFLLDKSKCTIMKEGIYRFTINLNGLPMESIYMVRINRSNFEEFICNTSYILDVQKTMEIEIVVPSSNYTSGTIFLEQL
jgi:hypothetical protein